MIVLDTHIWLWWVNGNTDLLSSTQKDTLEKSDQLAVCPIHCLEVA
ncbi:MAG: hypothetical protein VKL41_17005 [Snowella sp.]|nr:hypothetical protein [Snowella sp.]